MSVFLVSYDLNVPGQDYGRLLATLRQSPGGAQVLKSAWLIDTQETAGQLYNRLAPTIYQSDRLLVIEVTPSYQGWLTKEQWDWIKGHLG